MTALWYWLTCSRAIVLSLVFSCEPWAPPEQVVCCTHFHGPIIGLGRRQLCWWMSILPVSVQCVCYTEHNECSVTACRLSSRKACTGSSPTQSPATGSCLQRISRQWQPLMTEPRWHVWNMMGREEESISDGWRDVEKGASELTTH